MENILERSRSRYREAAIAGTVYFAVVFAIGFALGTVRTLWLVPRLGEELAVVIELPFMLAASWVVCGWVLRSRSVDARMGPRLLMGVVAFALLMLAEVGLSVVAFDRSPAEHVAELTTRRGLLGLAGQTVFALIPLLRRPS